MLLRLFSTFFLSFLLVSSPAWAEGEDAPKEDYVGYIELKPFVTNVSGTHFLKCEVTIQVSTEDAHHAINHHMAHIRNDLVFLFSSQEISKVEKVEGQQALAKSALRAVQNLLVQEEGEAMVNDLFFTSFVVQ